MFNYFIAWSLKNRIAVLVIAVAVILGGVWSLATMRVDILPDINKPTVAIFAEAEGLAPEEIEKLVLNPIEIAVAGAPGVDRVRGTASFGLAIVNVEFSWGSDIYRNRQIIQERIARVLLPEKVRPVLGPVGSIMGEVVWVGITSDDPQIDGMQLRTLADWSIRPALLRVPGVAEVIVMGGELREWQINVSAEKLRRYNLHLEDIEMAVKNALNNKSGGVLVQSGKEYPLRIIIAPDEVDDLKELAVGTTGGMTGGKPIRLADVAMVEEGPSPVRGGATIDGKPGAVLRIIRQPDAETLKVTDGVDEVLESIRPSLPDGVSLKNDLFRQEWFIRAGLSNVIGALRDGTILVIIILILFLMNFRATVITLTAIPLSILVTAIVFRASGFSVNVMTLGGLAVAIGELVDDAIVDVENVFRRVREWRAGGKQGKITEVVFLASSEVRNSIVYATVLVAVVFLPIFFIPGVEGKLLSALGAAYLISLVGSLVVSLSVTPVLCSFLLAKDSKKSHEEETRIVKFIKRKITPAIYWSIYNVKKLSLGVAAALLIAVLLYVSAGKEGLPPFNEGSATILVLMPVGTDVNTSNNYASKVEKSLMTIKGVRRVSHITGRAGADAHESGANRSELQVVFDPDLESERERLLRDVQGVLGNYGEASYTVGQPITHRVEELLSGVRAPVVIKVYGDNPDDMKFAAEKVVLELEKQPGMKNPQIQKDVMVPEFRMYVDTNRLAEYGQSSGVVAEELEMGLMGAQIGQVRIGPASVNVVARYDAESKGTAEALRDLPLSFAGPTTLGDAADIRLESGRNRFSHEGGKRVLVVSSNYQGSNIVGAVDKVKSAIESSKLPTGVTLSFEGNYKSQKENSRRLGILFILGLISIFGILFKAFRSVPIVLQIMMNIPTVLIGGIVGIWMTGGVINLAHLVGFISLAGIVSRNGIMLIGRCIQLARNEVYEFTPEVVARATLDRVVPVLMTSLVTALALVPLLLAGGEPGKELLHPLAVVIFGGLVSSTIISLFLTPALFYRFGKKAALSIKGEAGF
ncbi:MAG: efflux RND transporter permease subunit [Patescibacteria group bacterium]